MTFYESIPIVTNLLQLEDYNKLIDVPQNWHIAIADVANSTGAENIQKNKEINIIAASTISAILNKSKSQALPYNFGGDGSAVLIPPELVNESKKILASLRSLAAELFNLELRVAVIPVADIYKLGDSIKVSRLQLNSDTTLPVFLGFGLMTAEDLLRKDLPEYMITDTLETDLDFSGLECRWQTVKSPREEIVTLMFRPAEKLNIYQTTTLYKSILEHVTTLYGKPQDRQPITPADLSLTINPKMLGVEAKLKSMSSTITKHSAFQLTYLMAGSKVLNALGQPVAGVDFNKYKQDLAANTDSEKFDDYLRLVIAGTKESRLKLIGYLEELYKLNLANYGIHVSNAVNITCIVFDIQFNHIHFIDGSDGSFAKAANALKQQIDRQL